LRHVVERRGRQRFDVKKLVFQASQSLMQAANRANGLAAGAQALLWMAPIGIFVIGGRGLPTPGSFNDPATALSIIRASPDVTIVAGFICAIGVAEVFVVLAAADRLEECAPKWTRLSVAFGIIAASFLMIDGALGMAALPRLAQMEVHQQMVDGAYLATLGFRSGIDRVIPLTLGLWALTSSWPAWQHRRLPRPLTVGGLLLGLVGVAGAVLPVAGLATLTLIPLWTAGFAIVLFREQPAVQSSS
jgi:hypothetical protein